MSTVIDKYEEARLHLQTCVNEQADANSRVIYAKEAFDLASEAVIRHIAEKMHDVKAQIDVQALQP